MSASSIKFTVHGASMVPVNMPAVINGEDVMAAVQCLEVELVSDSAINGSLTLRFFGTDIPDAQALYAKDAQINADMSAAS